MRESGETSSQGSITSKASDDLVRTVLGDGHGRVRIYSSYVTPTDMCGARGMPTIVERGAGADVERNDEAATELKRVNSELAMTQDMLNTTQDTLKIMQSELSKMQFQMNFLLEKASYTSEDHDVTPLCTPLSLPR